MARNSIKKQNPIIVTGAAGFIGMHVCNALLARGDRVIGFDALTTYNDPALKKKRLSLLAPDKNFRFVKGNISKGSVFIDVVKKEKPRAIIHLAAQAGVRYSQENPQSYIDANVTGSLKVFEAARLYTTPVVYASSSSVYGEREGIFKESDMTDAPVSLYAATKRATELLAATYVSLYHIPMTGLRFFTVYGPWMRTDLAIYKFARLLSLGKPIPLFAGGKGKRSYTHISLVVEGVLRALDRLARRTDTAEGIQKGHTIYNLGSERTYTTSEMLEMLAERLGVEVKVNKLAPQRGDVMYTRASGAKAKHELGVTTRVSLAGGLSEFATWFRENEKFLLSLKDMHS